MDTNAPSGQCKDEILLNLKIKLSNFEAEIIIVPLATEAETKNGVAYKRKTCTEPSLRKICFDLLLKFLFFGSVLSNC